MAALTDYPNEHSIPKDSPKNVSCECSLKDASRITDHSDNTEVKATQRSNANKLQKVRANVTAVGIKAKESIKNTLRTFGMYIVPAIVSTCRPGRRFEEPLKVAVRKNRVSALLRATIHLVPIGVALWLIILNWYTYYLGSSEYNQIYYQLGAKAHEITVQASLAVILFSYIRHEVALGTGLPFGSLFSALQINQISYLWSMEFWGSVTSNQLSLRRKLVLLTIIILCFVLAATAGPSSAILLVPRLDYWSAGRTHIWLNATANDFWPDRLEGSSVPGACSFSQAFPISNECPASEWQSIQNQLLVMSNSVLESLAPYTDGKAVWPYSVQVTGKSSIRQLLSQSEVGYNPFPSGADLSWAAASTTQQSAIADALVITGSLWSWAVDNFDIYQGWKHGAAFSDQQDIVHTIKTDYFQPYSSTICAMDLITGQNDNRPIAFPIDGALDFSLDPNYGDKINASVSGYPAIEYPSLERAQLLSLPGSVRNYRVKWVELPQDPFNATALGVVIIPPSQPNLTTTDSSKSIVVCGIGLGWGSSSMNTSLLINSMSSTSSLPNTNLGKEAKVYIQEASKENDGTIFSDFYEAIWSNPVLYEPPEYPQIQVTISESWAEYLNPLIPDFNATVIDILMRSAARNGSVPAKPDIIARIILSCLVTNGLARVGFSSELQGIPRMTSGLDGTTVLDGLSWVAGKTDFFTVDPSESKDWLKFEVETMIKGYAYNTSGPSPKVAIGFLLTYCVLALGHVLYAGISGISSSAWDSIAEVTALAMNSSPTAALRNACAGITEMHIFKIPVRILSMRDEEGEGEHLELVFGDRVDAGGEGKTIKVNRKYGTMPVLKKTE